MPLPIGIMQPNAGAPPPRRSKRRLVCRVIVFLGLILAIYELMWSFWLSGVNIPDVEIDKTTGQKRVRRRPDKLFKRDHVTGEVVPTTAFDGIMEGYLTLMNIKIPTTGLKPEGDRLYSGVKATFCHIAWQLQDNNPTSVPTFSDLRDKSPLCLATRYSVDLWEITRTAEQYDWRNHTFAATVPNPGQGPNEPSAVVFHQSRCGSTVISNVLSGFMPQHTRVYSEAPAPMVALMACGPSNTTQKCDVVAHDALIRDVFYMMGRSPGPLLPQFVFYKFQSQATHFIDVFTRAMPEIPWIFAYRHPVEIMMSHFKNFQAGNPLSKNFMPNCLRNYGSDYQPALVKEIIAETGRTVDSLTKEEYCAAHLGSLGIAAVREHERTMAVEHHPHRWFVNYEELPFKVWEKIVPDLVPFVKPEQVHHMHAIGKLDSRGSNAGEHFVEDSILKQGRAPRSVKEAVELFMQPAYDTLEKYRLAAIKDPQRMN